MESMNKEEAIEAAEMILDELNKMCEGGRTMKLRAVSALEGHEASRVAWDKEREEIEFNIHHNPYTKEKTKQLEEAVKDAENELQKRKRARRFLTYRILDELTT